MKNFLHLIMVAFIACFAVGCATPNAGLGTIGGWDTNISDEAEEWAGFDRNATYETEAPLFLVNLSERTNGLALVPGMEISRPPATVRGPTSTEDYAARPKQWPWVRGVVKPGTRIRATILRSKGNVRGPNVRRAYVKARIMEGPFRDEVVDLEPISEYRIDEDTGRAYLVGPLEIFLRRVR